MTSKTRQHRPPKIINGKSERGDHPVVRTPLRQWTLKITKYADQLEAGLKGLDWPEGTLTAQKQWIGRSEGARYVCRLERCVCMRVCACCFSEDETRVVFCEFSLA